MPSCFALFCTHDSRRESCRMYQFPSDPEAKKQWLNNTRKTNAQLKPTSRICSCHFVKGKKQFAPTLFAWTNYISKIRRDLDKPLDEDSSERLEIVEEEFLEDNMAIPVHTVEVEVKTEMEDPFDEAAAEIEIENMAADSMQTEVEVSSTPQTPPTPPRRKDKKKKKKKRRRKERESEEISLMSEIEVTTRASADPRLVQLRVSILILAHEVSELQRKAAHVKEVGSSQQDDIYQKDRLTSEKISQHPELLFTLTGLTSAAVLRFLVCGAAATQLHYNRWAVVNLRLEEQLLIALMKLRCNLGFSDLAFRFRVSPSTVKNVIWAVVGGLHSLLFEQAIASRPLPPVADPADLPPSFASFANCRIVLRFIQIEAEASRVPAAEGGEDVARRQRTLRSLVGVSPRGGFIFVSELFPEDVSSSDVVIRSKIHKLLSPGDLILSVDPEVLNASDVFRNNGIDLNVPLLTGDEPLPPKASDIRQLIAEAVKPLEHSVERLRRYAVLDRIQLSYRVNASSVLQLCCALVNLENAVIEEHDAEEVGGILRSGDVTFFRGCDE